MSVNYGADTSCVSDIGLIDTIVTDPIILVGQRIARRLQTPRGGLAAVGDDPNFGWDVRRYVNAKMSPRDIAQAQQQIAAECTKDEEVQSALVQLSFTNGGPLVISIQLQASAGPFTLVLNVTQLTVAAVFNF